uniref:Uncharacterized protein n=1 Tax=Anas zonorhyncha TaxID=75864 RepID=A0A8B9USU1_9AVES
MGCPQPAEMGPPGWVGRGPRPAPGASGGGSAHPARGAAPCASGSGVGGRAATPKKNKNPAPHGGFSQLEAPPRDPLLPGQRVPGGTAGCGEHGSALGLPSPQRLRLSVRPSVRPSVHPSLHLFPLPDPPGGLRCRRLTADPGCLQSIRSRAGTKALCGGSPPAPSLGHAGEGSRLRNWDRLPRTTAV